MLLTRLFRIWADEKISYGSFLCYGCGSRFLSDRLNSLLRRIVKKLGIAIVKDMALYGQFFIYMSSDKTTIWTS